MCLQWAAERKVQQHDTLNWGHILERAHGPGIKAQVHSHIRVQMIFSFSSLFFPLLFLHSPLWLFGALVDVGVPPYCKPLPTQRYSSSNSSSPLCLLFQHSMKKAISSHRWLATDMSGLLKCGFTKPTQTASTILTDASEIQKADYRNQNGNKL